MRSQRARELELLMHGLAAGNRPGFCFDSNSDGETQARDAYDARAKFLGGAWRGTDIASASPKPDDQTPEDPEIVCEKYKARIQNAWKTNVADAARAVADAIINDPDASRAAHIKRTENAWRTAR